MRWTHIAGRISCATSGVCAYGEIVWFWRSNAGAKFADDPQATVATKPVTGKITYKS